MCSHFFLLPPLSALLQLLKRCRPSWQGSLAQHTGSLSLPSHLSLSLSRRVALLVSISALLHAGIAKPYPSWVCTQSTSPLYIHVLHNHSINWTALLSCHTTVFVYDHQPKQYRAILQCTQLDRHMPQSSIAEQPLPRQCGKSHTRYFPVPEMVQI